MILMIRDVRYMYMYTQSLKMFWNLSFSILVKYSWTVLDQSELGMGLVIRVKIPVIYLTE